MKDKETGHSRGFGFITFAESAQAEAAKGMHELDGSKVEAKASVAAGSGGPPAGSHSMGGDGGGGAIDESAKKLFVGGMSPETNEQVLEAFFTEFGVVESVLVMRDAGQRPRGFGFVTFRDVVGPARKLHLKPMVLP
jgi:RNA recognition motif-containing protein